MRALILSVAAASALTACSSGGFTSPTPAPAKLPQTGAIGGTGGGGTSSPTPPPDTCAGVVSTIGPYQYNAGSVPASDILWINAVASVSGISPTATTHVKFVNVTYSTTDDNGVTTSAPMPNMHLTFDPAASSPSLSYAAQTWNEVVPASLGGNVFLDGLAYVQSGQYTPRNGTVSGTFCADQPNVSVNWKFGAALYGPAFITVGSDGTPDYNYDGVKAADQFGGGDHAGTPEAAKSAFIGGAGSGGGGSNWTGSYSATGRAAPPASDCGCGGPITR